MAVNPWIYTHLEVKGGKHPISSNTSDVREQIPIVRVETRKEFLDKKAAISQQFPQRPAESPKRQKPTLSTKATNQKIISIKVVLPKETPRTAQRNCLCSCELGARDQGEEANVQLAVTKIAPAEKLNFEGLVDILRQYDRGVRNGAVNVIRRLARNFNSQKVLSDMEVHEVLKMLNTDNAAVKEGVLIMLQELSASTVNAKKFLDNGLFDELMLTILLGNNEDLQREALNCISELVEKEEHAHLWLEVMVVSGLETLFDLLDSTSVRDLQEAVLTVVANLAKFPRIAELLNEFRLQEVVHLLPCKNSDGSYKGTPELQALATKILANVISHNCSIVDNFLSRHADNAVKNIVDLLQHGSCVQQQESSRFLATLAFFKAGLGPIVSHHAVEHLLWAVTCSHCRLVREQASRALKNLCTNPDKQSVLNALRQVTERKRKLSDNISTQQQCESFSDLSDASDSFLRTSKSSSSVDLTRKISAIHLSRETRSRESMSQVERTVAEVTSVLTLSCRSDCLSLHEFDKAVPSAHSLDSTARSSSTSRSLVDEEYLGSLKVLTNVLVALRNLVFIDDCAQESGDELSLDAQRAQKSRIALLIQFGGLSFIEQLHFVSGRLLAVNPASFRNIDPTTLPPKEVTCTMKHARKKLMFSGKTAENKPQNRYRDFGLHVCEVDFVREAVNFVLLVAKSTALEFDPAVEDLRVFEGSKRRQKKLTFHRSALVVKSTMRFSRSSNGKRLLRSSSARSLGSETPRSSLETSPSRVQSIDEDVYFIKESLLDSKVVSAFAPWLTCGIDDIQANVLKAIRLLLYTGKISNQRTSSPGLQIGPPVREGWARKDSRPPSRHLSASPRSSTGAIGSVMTQLGYLCVRHVIQHCGAYLLDLLSPPATPGLGKTSLMVIREAVMSGETNTRLDFVKLGCFAQVIEFIRANEGDDSLQALAVVAIRDLVGLHLPLRQLFCAHGGMNLIMALYEYKDGILKEEAANTLMSFTSKGINKRSIQNQVITRRARTANGMTKRRHKAASDATTDDIWDKIRTKWERQDEVVKVLKKFDVRY